MECTYTLTGIHRPVNEKMRIISRGVAMSKGVKQPGLPAGRKGFQESSDTAIQYCCIRSGHFLYETAFYINCKDVNQEGKRT
jgi:hypothetical protein